MGVAGVRTRDDSILLLHGSVDSRGHQGVEGDTMLEGLMGLLLVIILGVVASDRKLLRMLEEMEED